ncbi:MAG TPA: SIS domain-containing protein, partial [Propionibacteriaceae bacterium]|nr:SIS domain-containing protein [Propionibacteriaceae bacterium]
GLDAAIGLMTRVIETGAVIQAFGTGHSEAFAMEIAGRAGGLIPTNKIALRDLVLHGTLTVDALVDQDSNATPTSFPSCGRSRRSIPGMCSSSPRTPA